VDSEALLSMSCGDPLSKRSVTMTARAEGEVNTTNPLREIGHVDEELRRR